LPLLPLRALAAPVRVDRFDHLSPSAAPSLAGSRGFRFESTVTIFSPPSRSSPCGSSRWRDRVGLPLPLLGLAAPGTHLESKLPVPSTLF
jgi:hypothetical protein